MSEGLACVFGIMMWALGAWLGWGVRGACDRYKARREARARAERIRRGEPFYSDLYEPRIVTKAYPFVAEKDEDRS